jgi:hypothetical protein
MEKTMAENVLDKEELVRAAQDATDHGNIVYSDLWGTDDNPGIFYRDMDAIFEAVGGEDDKGEQTLWEVGAYFFYAGIVFAFHQMGAPIGWGGLAPDGAREPEIIVYIETEGEDRPPFFLD